MATKIDIGDVVNVPVNGVKQAGKVVQVISDKSIAVVLDSGKTVTCVFKTPFEIGANAVKQMKSDAAYLKGIVK